MRDTFCTVPTNYLPFYNYEKNKFQLSLNAGNFNILLFSVNGGVGEWSGWSSCSKECGTGTKTTTRSCDNPAPANGGSDCTESLSESQDCNTHPCPGLYVKEYF